MTRTRNPDVPAASWPFRRVAPADARHITTYRRVENSRSFLEAASGPDHPAKALACIVMTIAMVCVFLALLAAVA